MAHRREHEAVPGGHRARAWAIGSAVAVAAVLAAVAALLL